MSGSPEEPFSLAFVRPSHFGALAGVYLPPEARSVDDRVLARLHPAEALEARLLRGRRQVEWAGGRLAYRYASGQTEGTGEPLLRGPGGEPLGSNEHAVSLSHKPRL